MESLKKTLRKYYVDGYHNTHVSLVQPKGKYSFDRQGIEKFWNKYIKLVDTEDKNDLPILGMAEKPEHYLPVLVDVDLKVKDDDTFTSEKLYTEEQIEEVVQVYQSVLRKIVESCSEKQLYCVLLEKDMYTVTTNNTTYIKHGFHLHFPYCFLNEIDQTIHLLPRVKEELKKLETFKNLGFEDSGDAIDKSYCKVPWLMYGSRKNENSQPYIVTTVYDAELNHISLEKAFKNYQLFNHKERLIKIKGRVKEYLPRILSIVPFNRPVCELKRGLISPLKERMKYKAKSDKKTFQQQSITEQLKIAKRLLAMISDFRAEDYSEWMNVGWVLYNISEGNEEGLELWCDFSSRNEDKYDEGTCMFEWERMVKKDLTLGTLRYLAKTDNPVEYQLFKHEETDKHIKNSLSGSHNDIAKALYAEFGDEFVCASISNKLWYQFINHKWEQIEEGVFLRQKISDVIVQRFTDAGKDLFGRLSQTQDKSEEAMINERIKQVQKMATNLKSSPYKSNVMKECMEVFYDKRFKEKLDINPNLIAFKNGVYDLNTNTFRPGRPEDFLSKNMPIDYIEYDDDDDKVQEIYTFLEKIFPDKSVRTYFLDTSCNVFVGGNQQKIVIFWTGEGDNGKSVTQSFFEQMLGKLAIKFNTNVVTGKKPSAGAAHADLARAGGGVRWAVLEEPNADEMINIGILKLLSGNDSFYARDLFEKGKDGREIKSMFKLIFIANKPPKIKYADKATWNRIRVIPFESTFCREDNPAPESYAEQLLQKRFPMDKKFTMKIPNLVSAFAWVLMQHRIKIENKPIYEPEKVRLATSKYQKQNDIYRQFMEERITEEKGKVLSLTELYSQFKEWYRESIPNNSIPIRSDVEEYFTKSWGEPHAGKKWVGFRFRTFEEDIASGDIVILDEDGNEHGNENNLPTF